MNAIYNAIQLIITYNFVNNILCNIKLFTNCIRNKLYF